MYHSITFNETINTWDDWHLIPTSRPVFNPPTVKTNYIDIPGANGLLDLTEVLTGYPLYNNRTGSIEFIVKNGYWNNWSDAYSTILNFLHGKSLTAYLEDDPYFRYEGRFTVNNWKSDKNWSLITFDYDVYPYKRERFSSLEDWLWDPFDFENGIIRNKENYTLTLTGNSGIISVIGREEPVTPMIQATPSGEDSAITVNYNGKTYTLNSGNNYVSGISFGVGEHKLVFTGNGTVKVDYRGGTL